MEEETNPIVEGMKKAAISKEAIASVELDKGQTQSFTPVEKPRFKKNRKFIAISPQVHCDMKRYCKSKGVLMEDFANQLIADKMVEEGFATLKKSKTIINQKGDSE